jgi:hypothetical protein
MNNQANISLTAHCNGCRSFQTASGFVSIRTVWLTPDIIQQDKDTITVTWKCSFGSICTAGCRYASGVKLSLRSLEEAKEI